MCTLSDKKVREIVREEIRVILKERDRIKFISAMKIADIVRLPFEVEDDQTISKPNHIDS